MLYAIRTRTLFLTLIVLAAAAAAAGQGFRIGSSAPERLAIPKPETATHAASLPAAASLKETATLRNAKGAEFAGRKMYAEAAQAFRDAIAADPSVSAFHLNLSIVYDHLRRTDDAIAAAKTAVELDPANKKARTQVCELSLQLKLDQAAVECYRQLMTLGQLTDASKMRYGIALVNAGEIKEARPLLEQTIGVFPDNASLNNSLAVVRYRNKKYEEAVDYFKKALELAPNEPVIRFNLGIAEMAGGNKSGALSQYRILSESDPQLAKKLFALIYRDKILFVDYK